MLLETISRDLGVKEIPGELDHPQIVLAHKIARVISQKIKPEGKERIDEIPWCSSMMNLWILRTSARLNFGRVRDWMANQGFTYDIVEEALGHEPNIEDNGVRVPGPTWSARAISWRDWGSPVAPKDAQPGDIVVLTRSGGAHVGVFMKRGLLFTSILGGNQSDKVCQLDNFLNSKVITIRRWNP